MQFNEQMLYILIEGTENSPEVTFIKKVIRQLVNAEKLPDIPSDVIAVGGSEVFNSFAKIIYNQSKLHQKIPVLALGDRDWPDETTIQRDREESNKNLIENKNVRHLYWDRHEWENFLLDEVEIIANIP